MQEATLNDQTTLENGTGADTETLDSQRHAGLNIDDQVSGSAGLDDGELGEDGDAALQKLQTELSNATDKHLRLAAEFENYKRRVSKERAELFQTAGRDVIQSLLPVLDDMERAAKTLEAATDLASVKKGLNLVFGKLKTILQTKGLKAMDSGGQAFDADLHEAITEIPAPTEALRGKVIDVVEPGYYMADKLIRHAKVVVGK